MGEYTKGPWKAIIEEKQPVPYYKRLICTVEHGDEYKAVVAERSEVCNKEEWEANARLMAAAPELLEAAKKLKTNIQTLSKSIKNNEVTIDEIEYLLDNDYCDLLDQAIQKAEGDNDG